MIEKDKHTVSCITFPNTSDEYGQKRTQPSSSREVEMTIYPFSNSEVDDIRFREVTNIGLTYDTSINDTNEIVDGNTTYLVKYVIPSKKYYQIFLRKK